MAPTDGHRRGTTAAVDSLLKAAEEAFSKCNWESAVFFSELAVALQPSDSKARESHCRALFACGEYLRVINEYKSLGGNGKANTQLVGDLVLRAQLLTLKEEMPNFTPTSSTEWLVKGLLARHKQDGKAASQAFLESWRLNPLNIEAQRAACHAVGGFYGATSTEAVELLRSSIASMSFDPSLEFLRKMFTRVVCGPPSTDNGEFANRSTQSKLSDSKTGSAQSLRPGSGGPRRPSSQQQSHQPRLVPSPTSPSLHLRCLWVRESLVNKVDLRRALEVCRDVSAQVPQYWDITPMYVDILATFTTTDAADEIFLYADKLLNGGVSAPHTADRPEPWYAAGIYHLCAADLAEGNFAHVHRETARRYLARALEVCPHFGPAWIALGRSFAANDESERAIQAYRSAIKHCPEWHTPWLLIGMEYLRVGPAESYSGQGVQVDYATALAYLERAKDLTPTDSEVRNQIGIYHSKAGDHEKAIASFIEAIDIENCRRHGQLTAQTKDIAKYHNNLAFSLCQNGQLEQAAEACRKALKVAPNGNCAETMESHQMLAFALSKQGLPSQALDHYHQAIAMGEKARGNVSTRAAHSLVNRLMRNISQDGIPGCLSMDNLVRHVDVQMTV